MRPLTHYPLGRASALGLIAVLAMVQTIGVLTALAQNDETAAGTESASTTSVPQYRQPPNDVPGWRAAIDDDGSLVWVNDETGEKAPRD
jgi:hypothetical protein